MMELDASETAVDEVRAPRLLGAAFLVVVATSLASGALILSAIGTGSTSDMLISVSSSETLLRLGVVAGLATSLGIVVLAVLLYVVLGGQGRIVALVALGWWLAEAIVLAVARIGDAALIQVGLDFVKAGTPADSSYQTMGAFLYHGLDQQLGSTTHMFFYCAGGLVWYYLFFRSRLIPRAISLFGLIAVAVGSAGIIAQLLGYDIPILVYVPILPFELTIGSWLLFKGIPVNAEPSRGVGTATMTASSQNYAR